MSLRRPWFLAVATLLAIASMLLPDAPPAPPPLGVVVLDPGHGGDEPGATANDIIERDSNLDLALRVRALLAQHNVAVVLTRDSAERPHTAAEPPPLSGYSATFTDLQARVAIANAARADAFVSIHSNFWLDPDLRGLQVWYNALRPFAEHNRELADLLLAGVWGELAAAGYRVPSRGTSSDTDLTDAAGHDTPLFVLGPDREVSRAEIIEDGGEPDALGFAPGQDTIRTSATGMPGALVELLFLSNEQDAALLRDDAARAAMARGIAAALLAFLGASR